MRQRGVPHGIGGRVPRRVARLLIRLCQLQLNSSHSSVFQRDGPDGMNVFDRIIEGILRLQAVQGRLRADKLRPRDPHGLSLCWNPGCGSLDSSKMQAAEVDRAPGIDGAPCGKNRVRQRRGADAQIVDGVVLAVIKSCCRKRQIGWTAPNRRLPRRTRPTPASDSHCRWWLDRSNTDRYKWEA